MTFIDYLCALVQHNPAGFFFLVIMFAIVCMALFTPEKRGGNGW